MKPFDRAIAFILPHETEYQRGHWGDDKFTRTENVPGDHGGATCYGIDSASHPGVDVAHLTRAQAIAIYRQEWDRHNLDALPDNLAIAAFDVWVNGGHANKWLQEAYNDTHPAAPLVVDGVLGDKSLAALRAADEPAILKLFLAERDARFRLLAQKPSQAKFLAGWLERDKDLRASLAA